MRVLVLNGGSSTVKVAIAEVGGGRVRMVARQTVEQHGGGSAAALFEEAIQSVVSGAGEIDAVGHRVVHGGTRFGGPVRIDADVEAAIESLAPLAPLHNPVALDGIRVSRARLRDLPMVAVFDTAFHRERPLASRRYALPDDLTEELGLWRYGFHGIAHASLLDGVAALEGATADRVTAVTLQLGRGCSACAIERGASIETSMGFTPLEGLVMGTRSGDVDPGLVLYLLRQGRSLDDVEDLLEKRSGLVGVGGSADMRELLRAEAGGDPRAALAIAIFVRRIAATVGAYFTLLEGDGRLVFGGGIGENSPAIRERVAAGLSAWGVRLDLDRNAANSPGRISSVDSRPAYVVRTDEETVIARAVEGVLAR
jgi:acetate kinase